MGSKRLETTENGTDHPGIDCRRNRLSPRHLAALELYTKQNTSNWSPSGVFDARFLPVRNHRLLQQPNLVSGRQHLFASEHDERLLHVLAHLGRVQVAVAGELQQERPALTSVRQVEYSSVPSQSVCPTPCAEG